MKKLAVSILLLFVSISFGQSVNNYKAVIVPLKFEIPPQMSISDAENVEAVGSIINSVLRTIVHLVSAAGFAIVSPQVSPPPSSFGVDLARLIESRFFYSGVEH